MQRYVVPVVLVTGTLLSASAMFMTVSVLALFLTERGLSQSQAGVVIGTVALVASFLGFFGGKFSDLIKATRAVTIGAVLSGSAFGALAFTRSFWVFLPLAACIGLARSISEPAMKSLLGRHPIPGRPDLGFRLRYLALCLGAILGPMAGLLFSAKWMAVAATGLVLIAYAAAFAVVAAKLLPYSPEPVAAATRGTRPSAVARSPALRDPQLRALITAGFAVFLVFSLFESMVPLALKTHFPEPGNRFSALLIVNAAFGIALQFPASWVNGFVSTRKLAVIGSVCFGAAFVVFAGASSGFALWIVAMIVFTCGEALTLPAGEILIDGIAPDEHKASYFGLAELRQLGYFVGPSVGGLVLQHLGPRVLFLAAAVTTGVAAGLYHWSALVPSSRIKRPEDAHLVHA